MQNTSFQCILGSLVGSLVYPKGNLKNYIHRDIDNHIWFQTCKKVKDNVWTKVGVHIHNEQSER